MPRMPPREVAQKSGGGTRRQAVLLGNAMIESPG